MNAWTVGTAGGMSVAENFESFEYGVDFLPEFFDSRTF